MRGIGVAAVELRNRDKFAYAHRGTLFLDEVADLSDAVQPKLLRILEDGVVCPIGATQAARYNSRLVAATSTNLNEAVAAGRFRMDLFYRLSAFVISLPPLRDRRGDLELLVEHFSDRVRKSCYPNFKGVTDRSLEHMKTCDWPGNIRELWNVILRLAVDEAMGRTCTEWSRGGVTKESLIDALRSNSGNTTAVAKVFRTSARTVVRRARKFGIDLDSFQQ